MKKEDLNNNKSDENIDMAKKKPKKGKATTRRKRVVRKGILGKLFK